MSRRRSSQLRLRLDFSGLLQRYALRNDGLPYRRFFGACAGHAVHIIQNQAEGAVAQSHCCETCEACRGN